jgi:membrane protease YdiL (CAAX protease family)
MNTWPEHAPLNPQDSAPEAEETASSENASNGAHFSATGSSIASDPDSLAAPAEQFDAPAQPIQDEPPPGLLFESFSQPEVHPPARIPNFGHLFLLGVLTLISLVIVALLTRSALHFHLFGISTVEKATTDIHYTLGSMAALYILTFAASMLVFPLFWHKSLFAGLQWRAATAFQLRRRLVSAAVVCFALALINGILMPGPQDTPIDKIFRAPGAAWLMFIFGITFAPFFEETVFRGFLLPALCTAYDWATERVSGQPARPPDENGHPNWSVPAMALGSLLTSIPFALLHAEQTGWAVGPLLLLMCVSLVLCWARLSTRSLAASVLVHACYNFLLFFIMLVSTGGFRHLDKM